MKDTDCVMNIMASWMTLDELEGTSTRRYLIYSSETNETNQFTYRQPFGIHFRYKHRLGDHNNLIHVQIYLNKTLVTKFWPDFNLT